MRLRTGGTPGEERHAALNEALERDDAFRAFHERHMERDPLPDPEPRESWPDMQCRFHALCYYDRRDDPMPEEVGSIYCGVRDRMVPHTDECWACFGGWDYWTGCERCGLEP
jgi:hypothetical protein